MSGKRAFKGDKAHRGKQVTMAEFTRLWRDSSRPLAQIAAELGISQQAMFMRARLRNLGPRPPFKPNRKMDPALMRQMYLAGVTLKDIGDHFGICAQRVGKAAHDMGLSRPRGSRWHRITIADWQTEQLREAMAQDAARCRAAMVEAGMLYRRAA